MSYTLLFLSGVLFACKETDKKQNNSHTETDTAQSEDETSTQEDTEVLLDPRSEEIDQVMLAVMEEEHIPGAAIGVAMPGYEPYISTYGLASLDPEEAASSDHLFRIGSVTKTYTSMLVLLLAEEGLLSIADPLGDWIPEFEDAAEITLQQLMQNTSGVADWGISWYLDNHQQSWSRQQLLDEIISRGVNTEPGSSYKYSNPGYVLLGLVIEEASGQSYIEALRQRVLDPLNLNRTFWEGFEDIPAPIMRGYSYNNIEYTDVYDDTDQSLNFSSGGLVASPTDFWNFWAALHSGQILSEESYTQMVTPGILNNGSATQYGLGIGIKSNSETGLYYGTDGGVWGFNVMAFEMVDLDIRILNMQNLHNSDASQPIRAVLDLLTAPERE